VALGRTHPNASKEQSMELTQRELVTAIYGM